MALVTIIVVNWNGRKLLSECLKSIEAQTFKSFETVLVDNGSVDGSVKWVRNRFPRVRIIGLPTNTGFCVANNIGLKEAKTKYVALLNNDAVAHPFWLERLVGTLEIYEKAGSAASKILYYGNRNMVDRAGDGYTNAGVGLLRGRGMPPEAFNRSQWIFGACAAGALYRKSMLDQIGFFDEDFFLLYEDVDLSFRAQLNGFKCRYVPDSMVYHKVSSTLVRDSETSIYYGHRNLEWVYFINMPIQLIRKTLFLHMIHTIGSMIYFSIRGNLRSIITAKFDAFKQIKPVLTKRRMVQKRKKVENRYLWDLFERERFIDRLNRRSSGRQD